MANSNCSSVPESGTPHPTLVTDYRSACSPEEFFIPNPNEPKTLNQDVLDAILARALANVTLLMADGDDE